MPNKSQALQKEVREVQIERGRGESNLRDLHRQFEQDANRYAGILERFPWLAESSEGTAFLTRLGEVATGQSLKILAIGALQRQETPAWTKVSRQVRLIGRFSDILRLVENVERHKGILEALKMQRPQPQEGAASLEEIEAQFSLVTVELPLPVRNRLAALPAGSKPGAAEPGGALVLPVPAGASLIQVASLRDPFQIPRRHHNSNGPPPPPPNGKEAFPALTLTGIIESPRGRVAIINNQMVREGERIDGVVVQAIRKHAVVLKSPSAVKHLTLPEFGSTSPLPGEPSP